MDHVLKMMETHSKALESQVSDRTKCLSDEMQKSEDLLYRMLPRYESIVRFFVSTKYANGK